MRKYWTFLALVVLLLFQRYQCEDENETVTENDTEEEEEETATVAAQRNRQLSQFLAEDFTKGLNRILLDLRDPGQFGIGKTVPCAKLEKTMKDRLDLLSRVRSARFDTDFYLSTIKSTLGLIGKIESLGTRSSGLDWPSLRQIFLMLTEEFNKRCEVINGGLEDGSIILFLNEHFTNLFRMMFREIFEGHILEPPTNLSPLGTCYTPFLLTANRMILKSNETVTALAEIIKGDLIRLCGLANLCGVTIPDAALDPEDKPFHIEHGNLISLVTIQQKFEDARHKLQNTIQKPVDLFEALVGQGPGPDPDPQKSVIDEVGEPALPPNSTEPGHLQDVYDHNYMPDANEEAGPPAQAEAEDSVGSLSTPHDEPALDSYNNDPQLNNTPNGRQPAIQKVEVFARLRSLNSYNQTKVYDIASAKNPAIQKQSGEAGHKSGPKTVAKNQVVKAQTSKNQSSEVKASKGPVTRPKNLERLAKAKATIDAQFMAHRELLRAISQKEINQKVRSLEMGVVKDLVPKKVPYEIYDAPIPSKPVHKAQAKPVDEADDDDKVDLGCEKLRKGVRQTLTTKVDPSGVTKINGKVIKQTGIHSSSTPGGVPSNGEVPPHGPTAENVNGKPIGGGERPGLAKDEGVIGKKDNNREVHPSGPTPDHVNGKKPASGDRPGVPKDGAVINKRDPYQEVHPSGPTSEHVNGKKPGGGERPEVAHDGKCCNKVDPNKEVHPSGPTSEHVNGKKPGGGERPDAPADSAEKYKTVQPDPHDHAGKPKAEVTGKVFYPRPNHEHDKYAKANNSEVHPHGPTNENVNGKQIGGGERPAAPHDGAQTYKTVSPDPHDRPGKPKAETVGKVFYPRPNPEHDKFAKVNNTDVHPHGPTNEHVNGKKLGGGERPDTPQDGAETYVKVNNTVVHPHGPTHEHVNGKKIGGGERPDTPQDGAETYVKVNSTAVHPHGPTHEHVNGKKIGGGERPDIPHDAAETYKQVKPDPDHHPGKPKKEKSKFFVPKPNHNHEDTLTVPSNEVHPMGPTTTTVNGKPAELYPDAVPDPENPCPGCEAANKPVKPKKKALRGKNKQDLPANVTESQIRQNDEYPISGPTSEVVNPPAVTGPDATANHSTGTMVKEVLQPDGPTTENVNGKLAKEQLEAPRNHSASAPNQNEKDVLPSRPTDEHVNGLKANDQLKAPENFANYTKQKKDDVHPSQPTDEHVNGKKTKDKLEAPQNYANYTRQQKDDVHPSQPTDEHVNGKKAKDLLKAPENFANYTKQVKDDVHPSQPTDEHVNGKKTKDKLEAPQNYANYTKQIKDDVHPSQPTDEHVNGKKGNDILAAPKNLSEYQANKRNETFPSQPTNEHVNGKGQVDRPEAPKNMSEYAHGRRESQNLNIKVVNQNDASADPVKQELKSDVPDLRSVKKEMINNQANIPKAGSKSAEVILNNPKARVPIVPTLTKDIEPKTAPKVIGNVEEGSKKAKLPDLPQNYEVKQVREEQQVMQPAFAKRRSSMPDLPLNVKYQSSKEVETIASPTKVGRKMPIPTMDEDLALIDATEFEQAKPKLRGARKNSEQVVLQAISTESKPAGIINPSANIMIDLSEQVRWTEEEETHQVLEGVRSSNSTSSPAMQPSAPVTPDQSQSVVTKPSSAEEANLDLDDFTEMSANGENNSGDGLLEDMMNAD